MMEARDTIVPMSDRPCQNCGTALSGRWCHACGQDSRNPLRELRSLFEEFLESALSWDSKLVTTLKVLASRPGELTVAFVAGRRARYLGPVRLYLLLSLIYVTVYALLGGEPVLVYIVGGGDIAAGQAEIGRIERWLSLVLVLLMPLAALIMAVLFHRATIPLVQHLVFVLHVSGLSLLVWALGRPLSYIAGELVHDLAELVVSVAVNVPLAFYIYRAARAHYGRGELDTFWRVLFYGVASAALVRGVVLLTLRLVDGA